MLVAITLSSKRLVWLMRFLLSSVTSFFCLKLIYPKLFIWSEAEYTILNITNYFQSGMLLLSLSLLGINLLFFYWAFSLLLQQIFNKPINKRQEKYQNKIKLIGERTAKAIIIKVTRRVSLFLRKYLQIKGKDIENASVDSRTLLQKICNFFSITIHLLLCCILLNFGLKYLLLLSIMIFIIMPFFVFFIFPISKTFIDQIVIILKVEADKPY